MTIKGTIPVALAAVLGCMHGAQRDASASTVAETDVGRLGPEQAGLVSQARQGLDGARDALSRTRLGLQDAQNEEGTAKADLEAAGADQKVADAQQKVANDSRAPEALETARRLQERAKAHQQAAQLHLEYAGKLVGEREAEVRAAERQVEVAQARVEWSKLQALEQARNPAATKYDASRFQAAVNEAQGKLDEATKNARSLEAQASAARQRWEDSRGRLPADGDSNRTSTGSSGQ
jgi:chromosome segregation ATPase